MSTRKKIAPNAIGTRNESSLHRALKFEYAGAGGKTEAAAFSFVADGITKSGEYIEVQTGSFAPLKKKVTALSKGAKIRIIHPIAVTKILEVYSPTKTKGEKYGKLLYRRKSPLKGTLWNLFDALIHAPELPLVKGVTIEAVLADITEIRVKDGKGSWRRKGISIKDRCLTCWRECIVFSKKSDYLTFIPFKKNEEFTTTLLAARASTDKHTARKALYVLTKIGA
ncbi:MAG: hypothetical protein LBU66_05170, partial [Treponema sp.]|nr:hypothetical protein [Treponema sp.]